MIQSNLVYGAEIKRTKGRQKLRWEAVKIEAIRTTHAAEASF